MGRVAQVMSNTASKVGKIGTMRKNIARILTVLNTKERQNLRKLYADQKTTLPKSLRPKLTHKRRLALKADEQRRKSAVSSAATPSSRSACSPSSCEHEAPISTHPIIA